MVLAYPTPAPQLLQARHDLEVRQDVVNSGNDALSSALAGGGDTTSNGGSSGVTTTDGSDSTTANNGNGNGNTAGNSNAVSKIDS